jgi:hypothetical protein
MEEPEPVSDEFHLAKLAEAAENEDRRIRAVNALRKLQAEADYRERVAKLMPRSLKPALATRI